MKEKYTYPNMIKHMRKKGITFESTDERSAINTLSSKNYYFKLTSYRKNFEKNQFGKYKNLDFGYLTDLASIDAQLRYYLLQLSLNIEHGIKTILIDLITKDPKEDGYSIIKDFRSYNQFGYDQTMIYLKKNSYLKDLYIKHKAHPSVWMFLEVAPFGTLSTFVDFYFKRTNNKRIETAHKFLKYAKNIRNACAHNNSILVNLFSDKERLRFANTSVVSLGIPMGLTHKLMRDRKVNDLVCLFYLHKTFSTSVESYEHFKREGNRLLNRALRHKNYYEGNANLSTFYNILNALINY
ncbi:Abi family protein [Pediococcus pentosaceus]|uniref:Abi family protein n=1 Tax=Pediococcus pentosaceus TaxID=1255 RepID=UPI0018FF094F|nr:Abi family protein [Pediococcus pentosaceus]MBF7122493.1 Abi family protein [Pediococcus pentosaceus]MBF7131614.1 Abi family protein [Pediococcus pentosaceus]